MRLSAVALLVFLPLGTLHSSQAQRPCNIAYRCSDESNPVYAANGNLCIVFRNSCYLASENCDRQNRYEEELKQIPKDECQNACPENCPEDGSPVCGYFNQERRTFASRCAMDKYSCEQGFPYELYNNGPCSFD